MDPTEWLTLGLLVFAAVQVAVQVATEIGRRRERAEDERIRLASNAHELDISFQTVWAEQFRLEGLANAWDHADLIELSVLGVLRSEDVLPRDWTVVMHALARLGSEAGYLGSVAMTLSHDTARQIATFNESVKEFATHCPHPGAANKMRFVQDQYGPQLEPHQKGIRTGLRELSLLLWDATRHSEPASRHRVLDFKDDLSSEFGQHAVTALAERAKAREVDAKRLSTESPVRS
jgi:hypothetical protein